MYLYNDLKQLITSSGGYVTAHTLTRSLGAGTYYLKVNLYGGGSGTYDLEVPYDLKLIW